MLKTPDDYGKMISAFFGKTPSYIDGNGHMYWFEEMIRSGDSRLSAAKLHADEDNNLYEIHLDSTMLGKKFMEHISDKGVKEAYELWLLGEAIAKTLTT